MVTRIDHPVPGLHQGGSGLTSQQPITDSRNLQSQPPNLSSPINLQKKPSGMDLEQHTQQPMVGRRTMIKNTFKSSNRGSSHNQRSIHSPTGISNFSISNNQVSRITKPSEVTVVADTPIDNVRPTYSALINAGGQSDQK